MKIHVAVVVKLRGNTFLPENDICRIGRYRENNITNRERRLNVIIDKRKVCEVTRLHLKVTIIDLVNENSDSNRTRRVKSSTNETFQNFI